MIQNRWLPRFMALPRIPVSQIEGGREANGCFTDFSKWEYTLENLADIY